MPEPKLVMRKPKLGVLKKVAANGEGALIRQRPPPADRAVSALPLMFLSFDVHRTFRGQAVVFIVGLFSRWVARCPLEELRLRGLDVHPAFCNFGEGLVGVAFLFERFLQ